MPAPATSTTPDATAPAGNAEFPLGGRCEAPPKMPNGNPAPPDEAPSALQPFSPSALSSICIVRLSALGDIVMTLPLIKMLRRNYPAAHITWIIGRAALPLVSTLAADDKSIELIPIEKPRTPADYLALRRQFKNRTFDVLLCLQASWRANFLYPCIRARRKIGYSPDRAKDLHALFIRERIPAAPPHSHIIDGFFQFAEHLGATRAPSDTAALWPLTLPPDALAWAAQTLPSTPFLAISPTASKPERNWTPESYAAIIAHAWRAHKLPSILLGAPAPRDRAMADAIKQNLRAIPNPATSTTAIGVTTLGNAGVPPADEGRPDPRHACGRGAGLTPSAGETPALPENSDGFAVGDLTGQTTLPQLAAALSRCAALLAPDTGAVHIARALARPVIGLYAVAPATRTGPYQATEYCIDKFPDALACYAPNQPAATAPWSFRIHDPRAMQLIPPAEVCAQLDRLMAARQSN